MRIPVMKQQGHSKFGFKKTGLLIGVMASGGFWISAHAQYAEPPQITWGEKLMVDSSEAYQGPWRMNESDFRYVDDPAVILFDSGEAGLVWVDQQEQEVFFQRVDESDRKHPAEPVNVSQSPDIFSWLPRIAHHPENPDKIYVVWQDIVFSGGSHGGEIFFTKSEDGGRSFDQPVNLSNTQNGAGKGRLSQRMWDNGSLDFAIGPKGNIYITWTEYEGRLRVTRSTDGGSTFSEPLTLADENHAGPARAPSIAVHDQHVHVVWSIGEDAVGDIYQAASKNSGESFDDPEAAVETNGHSDAPQIAFDSRGVLHLVFGKSDEGPMRDYRILYADKQPDASAFNEPRELSEAHTEEFESVHYPTIRTDRNDNLYILWELFPDNMREARGLGVTTSGNGGASFARPVIVPESNQAEYGMSGSRQGSLMTKLDVNGGGDIAVVNSTFRSGEGSYIWLWRGSAMEQ